MSTYHHPKHAYTVTFADGETRDVETSRGIVGARQHVTDQDVTAHGGIVAVVRAGSGFTAVKTGLTAQDEAWLAQYAGGPLDDGGQDL